MTVKQGLHVHQTSGAIYVRQVEALDGRKIPLDCGSLARHASAHLPSHNPFKLLPLEWVVP